MLHNFFIRWSYPWFAVILLGVIVVIMIARKYLYKRVVYRHALGSMIKKNCVVSTHIHKKIFYCTRLFVLILLALLVAKPQLVDVRSKVPVEGISIVIDLDVSGSMQFKDYSDDDDSRFDVAKKEAIRFIDKREHDALGLVLFGQDTVSRCPITFDKKLLKDIVKELQLGVINADGTMLITSIVTAANRLKHSHAKSKVMIVLTDGDPSEGDMDPKVGIEIAKNLGIKIYTIGIGSEEDRVFMSPYGTYYMLKKINKELLTKIANETGGNYFLSRDARDMRRIYDKIDALEKVEHEVPVFSLYYDLLIPFVVVVMGLIFFELIFSTWVWFAL